MVQTYMSRFFCPEKDIALRKEVAGSYWNTLLLRPSKQVLVLRLNRSYRTVSREHKGSRKCNNISLPFQAGASVWYYLKMKCFTFCNPHCAAIAETSYWRCLVIDLCLLWELYKQYRSQDVYSENGTDSTEQRVYIVRTIQTVLNTGCLQWEQYNSSDHRMFVMRAIQVVEITVCLLWERYKQLRS